MRLTCKQLAGQLHSVCLPTSACRSARASLMPSPRKPTAKQADWVAASVAEACALHHQDMSCRLS